jgi:hypothetical protein
VTGILREEGDLQPALAEAGEGTVLTSCLAHARNFSLLSQKLRMRVKEVHAQILGKRKEILEEFGGTDDETSGEIIGNVEIFVEFEGVEEEISEEF